MIVLIITHFVFITTTKKEKKEKKKEAFSVINIVKTKFPKLLFGFVLQKENYSEFSIYKQL